MTDNEKIVLYAVKHALPSERVTKAYLDKETDLPLEELTEALNSLIRQKLVHLSRREYIAL